MTASRRVEVVAGVVVVLAHEVEVQRVFPSLRRHLEERLVVATAFDVQHIAQDRHLLFLDDGEGTALVFLDPLGWHTDARCFDVERIQAPLGCAGEADDALTEGRLVRADRDRRGDQPAA